jgi:acetolactate synthase-1/2/3 large subunit
LQDVAFRLGAPVLHTAMGKCAIARNHPLAAGMTWHRATSDASTMGEMMSPLFREADGLLAVGCRFSQVSTGTWSLEPPPIAQIDIDPDEIGRHYPVQLGIVADARAALIGLLGHLILEDHRPPWAKPAAPRPPWRLPGMELLGPLRRALPADAIVAADVTRLAYILMADFPLDHPRTFLHPAGAVAMGYGLPAALGAKAALPGRTVVAVVGDGGFQMSALELATAVQEKLPVVVVLVNDNCLTLIKATQKRRYGERFIAVDLHNPDFGTLALAYDVPYWRAGSDEAFEKALREALDRNAPALIEVRPSDAR